jgi:uncharacterized protein
MLTLTLSFFIIALLYALVGFGGGTSYIAILAVTGISYALIPKVSLICNLLVVSGGCYHFWKQGHADRKLILPFVLSSVPMAFLGGFLPLTEKNFYILLTVSLILCGLRILFLHDRHPYQISPPSWRVSFAVGAVLGLLSGMVGIGGGIFLSPLLINLGWARSKHAAAVASFFIFFNSLAGLAGQMVKNPGLEDPLEYAPLFLAVIIGGQIGSRLGSHKNVSFNVIQKATGVLTLFISIRLLLKNFG